MIPNHEFEFTFSRSSGAGGQNINKVNTKVTLKWDIDASPSLSGFTKKKFKEKFGSFINSNGIVQIVGQRFRTQSRNITDCQEKLFEMIREAKKPVKKRIGTKPTRSSIKKRIEGKKKKGLTKKNRQKVDY